MSRYRLLVSLVACLLFALPAVAFEVEVVIENVAPDNGVFLTPAWVGFHTGSFDSYDPGVAAALFPGLEQLAEDGNNAPFSDFFAAEVPMGVQATIPGPGGPIFSGDRAILRFELDPTYHRYFSYASMVIPSNDAFVANGNPLAHRVFDPNGNFTPVEIYVLGNEVNDAGTEVNDEVPANVAALAQAAPDTGVDENGVVGAHPGFLAGGNILAARPNGNFTRPGFRIAKVTVRAARTTQVHFPASADQEVPPNGSQAVGACHASLNLAQTELSVSCEHDITNTVVAAHIHAGAAGENGDVVFPFDDPAANPISQTFAVTAAQVETFFAGGYYVNIHSDVVPSGEIRGQIDGCFEGPGGLCLQGERFAVSADWQSDDAAGAATAVEGTADAGFFTFFDADNIELDVKVLDGCAINGHYWVFAAGTTNVGVDMVVEDTANGTVRNYSNPNGQVFEAILDIEAFATCP